MAARPRITGHRLALQHASIPGSVTYFNRLDGLEMGFSDVLVLDLLEINECGRAFRRRRGSLVRTP
jgi:hypothetical protein